MNNTICIIPARMGSSRFPGKALEKICGIEMLHHCFIRAKLAECFSDIYIATPDQEIHDFSKSIGCTSIDTKDTHTCLLYTSPSPRDRQKSRMPSSA